MSYLDDLLAQPTSIRDTAAALLGDAPLLRQLGDLRGRVDAAVLTGMGTSHTALYPLHLRLTAAGVPAAWMEASELLHYASGGPRGRTLVVVVSQSGETVEVVRLLDDLAGRATVVGVTNGAGSTLARRAAVPLVMRAGQEGIVATKTYLASLVALDVLGGALLGELDGTEARLDDAARALEALLERRDEATQALVDALGERPEELFAIGRGPSFASALAAALILKEASHTAAEPLSGGHFRHGPLEMVSERTRALLFAPRGPRGDLVRRLAGEIAGYGGRVVLVGPRDGAADLPLIDTGALDEAAAPLVDVAAAELYAIPLSSARGHAVGTFERMGKVTREE